MLKYFRSMGGIKGLNWGKWVKLFNILEERSAFEEAAFIPADRSTSSQRKWFNMAPQLALEGGRVQHGSEDGCCSTKTACAKHGICCRNHDFSTLPKRCSCSTSSWFRVFLYFQTEDPPFSPRLCLSIPLSLSLSLSLYLPLYASFSFCPLLYLSPSLSLSLSLSPPLSPLSLPFSISLHILSVPRPSSTSLSFSLTLSLSLLRSDSRLGFMALS